MTVPEGRAADKIQQSRIVWDDEDAARPGRFGARRSAIVFADLASSFYERLKALGCVRCPQCRDYVLLEGHACATLDRHDGASR